MTRADLNLAVVVVTYNRFALLKRCIAAINGQTLKPSFLFVVDNASTDVTEAELPATISGIEVATTCTRLAQNMGGAGGFAEGLREATSVGADWIWMMDDDAEPHPEALEELMRIAVDPRIIYGSLAVSGQDTSWITTILTDPPVSVSKSADVPAVAPVESLPFLGFLIHRNLVLELGFPDPAYFIAADDIEYCLRAKRAGVRLFIAGRSLIEHPKSAARRIRFLGTEIVYLSLPPWKRYYDTRNRILNARKYAGHRLLTRVLPGSVIRLTVALIQEPRKWNQLWAFLAGFIDGLLNIKGRRHEKWRIRT